MNCQIIAEKLPNTTRKILFLMANLSFRLIPGRQKSSGEFGIYLAISHKNQTRYISTGLSVSNESQFQNGKACRCKNSSAINNRLSELLHEFHTRLYKLNIDDYADCTSLKDALLGRNKSEYATQLTLTKLMSSRISKLKNEGRTNYARMNQDSLKVYERILGDLPVCKLTRNHIVKLDSEMKSAGLSTGSRQIRMAHLKAAISEAITDRIVKFEDHPFSGFKTPAPGLKQTDLTLDDFLKLRDADLKSTRASFARDIFLLSFYLGGINLVDLLEADLSRDEIRYSRKKTRNKKNGNSETTFTIPTPARAIIKKYAPNGKFIWPGKSDRYVIIISYLNNCFAMLRKELGISPLSYYSARHTFAQFAFEVGTPLEVVEYLLGQTVKSNRPIYNYVRVMTRHADFAIQNVLDYTNRIE